MDGSAIAADDINASIGIINIFILALPLSIGINCNLVSGKIVASA
jgi:hypothetical protein